MKFILFIFMCLVVSLNSVQAGQCYGAYKEAKKLEKMVSDVYFVSETDDTWKGFASWSPVKKITTGEIRKVLRLGGLYDGEKSFFSMKRVSHLKNFLNEQIEVYGPDNYNEPQSQRKLKRLLENISQKYGRKARLIMFGSGDGDSSFVGYHMIILIDKNGCVLGLKALTAWT